VKTRNPVATARGSDPVVVARMPKRHPPLTQAVHLLRKRNSLPNLLPKGDGVSVSPTGEEDQRAVREARKS